MSFINKTKIENAALIRGVASFPKNEEVSFHLEPSKITIAGLDWNVEPNNLVRIDTSTVEFSNFRFLNELQSIGLNGSIAKDPNANLKINLKDFDLANFNIATKEIGQKVIFLRKLQQGGSHHSFGIHVAKMAGMPRSIVERAANILTQLEQKSIDSNDMNAKVKNIQQPQPQLQLSIFDTVDETAGKLKEALIDIDVNRMTPIECMLKLNELKQALKEE